MHVNYSVVLEKVGKWLFVVLRVIAARCYASHVDEAVDMIFLEKAKKVIERMCGIPYSINDGFVHRAIY
jgi:hypothetical protein